MRTRGQLHDFRGVAFAAVLAGALFGAAEPARAQAPYTFVKIQFPGATATEAHGINNSGHVVGTYRDPQGRPHGYLFDGVNYTTIDFPGATYNYAFGISRTGQITGSYSADFGIGPYHSFLLEGGTFTAFDPPTKESDARAINESGQVVGVYNAGFGTQDYGFLKTGENYITIDYPAANGTFPFGINDAGIVTGTYRDASGLLHGFRYSGGTYTPIDFPGALETFIGGINNLGTMVGGRLSGLNWHGFVLAGTSLRTLNVNFAGATSTTPRAINDNGLIAGTYFAPDCPNGCAFLATPQPAMVPPCQQTFGLTYTGGVLNMGFTLATSTPTTWATYLITTSGVFRVWSVSLPVVPAVVPLNYSLPAFPPLGRVVGLSILSTATGGPICADYAMVETGTAAAPR